MLTSAMNKPSQKLNLIDQIQQLGLAYHFEFEIAEQLEQIHRSYFEFHCGDNDDNLHTIALLFRLLRQQGYNVSCGIYRSDDILNDALTFTITHLESIDKRKVSPNLEKQVSHALNHPIRKGLPRLEVRRYIQFYQEEPSHNEVLLSLAKLDFNSLQGQHRKELGNLTRWWKDIDIEREFPFARDRLVELYTWMLGVHFEPEYEIARGFMTKMNVFLTIIDDIYDVYGTLEELELFTKAIERWDVDAKEGLLECMQVIYKMLLDFYDEIGYELTRKGRSHHLFYAKEAMKIQVRAYLAEAKWFHHSHVPTMEEYLPIALTSIGIQMALVASFLGMGDTVTKDVFDWLLSSDTKIVKALRVIGRLMNDIAGHKFEQERGHVASSVECFMKQYKVTEEEAKKELCKQVADAWKDINEELCRPTAVPRVLLIRIINFAGAIHAVYEAETDHFVNAGTNFKEFVTCLLVNPCQCDGLNDEV
ncbi:hypothetical protein EUGRSUZ_L02618 [Eucalyptus grandis]|uniref:(+)-delta-cadinene synthase n=1 Tax=Eucalyptus grandis TaxID=71139 RepID=A0AAD9T910_EUCGR|nr:hypothetical protein EUGRSUZ_L02618 [Eucalyptus grandis]